MTPELSVKLCAYEIDETAPPLHFVGLFVLSTKQKEVCLLLTEGPSYQHLAERLGVRPNTIIDHVRKIYDKLDVRSHHELLSKLAQESYTIASKYH